MTIDLLISEWHGETNVPCETVRLNLNFFNDFLCLHYSPERERQTDRQTAVHTGGRLICPACVQLAEALGRRTAMYNRNERRVFDIQSAERQHDNNNNEINEIVDGISRDFE